MKLKHRITGTILAIAFFTTTALPAATIPQLKSPPKSIAVKAPVAPKIPVVKVASAPKIPTVKVPSVPKIPVAPKVPAVKIPTTPKVPVVKAPSVPKIPATPKVVKVPSAPKIPVSPKVPSVRIPTAPKIVKAASAPKVPTIRIPASTKAPEAPKVVSIAKTTLAGSTQQTAKKIGPVRNTSMEDRATSINTGKLKNLKEKLQVEVAAVRSAGVRFNDQNFTGTRADAAGSLMDGIRSGSGSRDQNPLPSQADQMIIGRGAQVSDDPATPDSQDTGVIDAVKNFFGSVVGSILSGAGTRSAAGGAASGAAGSITGAAGTILTANGTPEEKRNEFEGFLGLFRQGAKGTIHAGNAKDLDDLEYQTPLPDDMGSSGPKVVTKDDIKGIKARRGAAGEPEEESSGSSGPVNNGANGTGKFGSLSQPTAESSSGTRVTTFDAKGIQTRIESRINTGNR